MVAFSVGEEELAGLDTAPLLGHLAAWNYFQSIDTPENADFIAKWKTFIGNDQRVTNDPMEAHYIGFNMWVEAVEKAGSTDPAAVIDAMIGVAVPNLTGGMSAMMPNHHITKPVLIGEIQDDGQFNTVGDGRARGRRRVVRLPRGLQGPDLRLACAAGVRQFQRQDREVRQHRRQLRPVVIRTECRRRPPPTVSWSPLLTG